MGKLAETVAAWLKPEVDEDITKKGVVWNAVGEMQSCVFCDLVQNDKENELVFQDELVAAFLPLKPASKQHFLVIPKKHISTVGDLTFHDKEVLARMREVAERLLKCDPSNAQYSFHMPPWNSIDHLHLHAFETPFLSRWQGLRFSEGKPWCASFAVIQANFCVAVQQEEKQLGTDPEPNPAADVEQGN